MNPIRWLFRKSEELAHRRGGAPTPIADRSADSLNLRDSEPRVIDLDGTPFCITDPMRHEALSAFSADREKYVRVVQVTESIFQLSAFARQRDEWRLFDGPSMFGEIAEARAVACGLLGVPNVEESSNAL